MTGHGRFITLEGGEGTGKSTQARRLAEALRTAGHEAVLTREPGGSPGAEDIRQLLVTGETDRWTPLTETLLLFAARADHLARTIHPALARGAWVVSDRFFDSTRAYQGAAQGVPDATIDALIAMVAADARPDLTLVLDLPAQEGLARAAARGPAQRYERFGAGFHAALAERFRAIAAAEPERCVLIDASGSADEVAARIWAAVTTRLTP